MIFGESSERKRLEQLRRSEGRLPPDSLVKLFRARKIGRKTSSFYTDASVMPLRRFRYQDQDSRMTLREGLKEYFEGHPDLLIEAELDAQSKALFHSHDLCHVLFGLDTDMVSEALADGWAVLGTDVGWKRYWGYFSQSRAARNLFQQIGWVATITITIRALPKLFQVLRRARRMKGKWPWGREDAYLDRPLGDIRREYNVRIL
jgi:hypothetical protein